MEKEKRNYRPQRNHSDSTGLSPSSGNGQDAMEDTTELTPPPRGPADEEGGFSNGPPIGDSSTRAVPSQRTRQPDKTTPVEEARRRMQKVSETVADAEAVAPAPLQDTFLDERNDVMSVINELEEQLDRHQDVRERLERELKESNDRVQNAGQRTQELEWQVVTLQTRVEALEQLRQEVALLEEELASTNAQLQASNEEQSRNEKERSRLRNELKTANKQLEELWAIRKERDGLRGDLGTLTSRIEELERSQRDLVDERGALAARLKETAVALEEARGERHQHQILLRAAEDRTRELSRVQEELADKLEGVRADKKALQVQVAQLERENARLVEQRQFYETELSSMRNASRSAEVALSSVKKAFAEVRVALTETKSRARRRMIETWPRIGMPLRGVGDGGCDDDQSDTTVDETTGAEMPQGAGEV